MVGAGVSDHCQGGAHPTAIADRLTPVLQVEPTYLPEEQKAWLKDASNAVKRHGFYLRKAIVSGGARRPLAAGSPCLH